MEYFNGLACDLEVVVQNPEGKKSFTGRENKFYPL